MYVKNFKQTSMLCSNHSTNRALNTCKFIIFVKTKVIFIIMVTCSLVLIIRIRNCLKCFWKIIDHIFITGRFTFLLLFLFDMVEGFPFLEFITFELSLLFDLVICWPVFLNYCLKYLCCYLIYQFGLFVHHLLEYYDLVELHFWYADLKVLFVWVNEYP